ncbi:MAG TPA: hypothetical protein PLJ84_00635 [Bacteroidales bacterium]|nr:hypothetical protein [Bacteroidales bacterium]HPT01076.1 hypothetical protein [Bacteroidales bacterium]
MQRNYLVDLVAGQINIYWMVKMAYPRYVSGYPPPDAISGAVGCRQHIPKIPAIFLNNPEMMILQTG